MKTKLLSLLVIALSLFWIYGVWLQVFAQSEAIARVEIVDSQIAPSCTIFSLDFGDIDVSIYDQEYVRTWDIHCTFLQSPSMRLVYQLSGSFSSSNYTIPGSAIWVKAWDLKNIQWNLSLLSSLVNYYPFDIPLTVYIKDTGTVWEMDQEIDFKLNVPGGTPAWEYKWVLMLTIQPN